MKHYWFDFHANYCIVSDGTETNMVYFKFVNGIYLVDYKNKMFKFKK